MLALLASLENSFNSPFFAIMVEPFVENQAVLLKGGLNEGSYTHALGVQGANRERSVPPKATAREPRHHEQHIHIHPALLASLKTTLGCIPSPTICSQVKTTPSTNVTTSPGNRLPRLPKGSQDGRRCAYLPPGGEPLQQVCRDNRCAYYSKVKVSYY